MTGPVVPLQRHHRHIVAALDAAAAAYQPARWGLAHALKAAMDNGMESGDAVAILRSGGMQSVEIAIALAMTPTEGGEGA